MNQPFSAFSDQNSGQTASRLQAARQCVDQFLVTFIHSAFSPFIAIVFLIVYASRVHWTLVPTYLIAIPAVAGGSYLLGRRVRDIQAAIIRESAQLAGSATEVLRNAELVKSLGLATQESDRIAAASGSILELEIHKNRAIRRLSFFHGAGIHSLRLCVIVLMVYLVSRQEITMGQFFSLFLYLYMLLNPIQELSSVLFLYRETEASLESIEPLLSAVPMIPATAPVVGPLEQVDFEEVSFTYRGGSHRALSGMTFTARRGEVVAFVGPSGAGKTTLLKILLGLYAPESAVVRFNGQSAADLDFHSFRERIGLVTQDVQLFTGTIRDNLIFVRPQATDEECREALQHAVATPLLARASQGLDTPIGEGGLKLSGGEKQRLAIARALLRRPDLLILDEATSALDSITEREVAETLEELRARHNGITLVIAHRLSTIRMADRIYVLDQGRVADTGTHEGMLSRAGLYFELWRQQTGALNTAGGSSV